MRKYITALLFFCCSTAIRAQDKPLMAEGVSPNLYLSHTVVPKENYYSIGRLYNASPKDQIAPFNSLQMDKGLSPGQTIKIPLATTNFSQDGIAASDEALVPVYHTVQEKEGLYRISVNHNKVPVDNIKKWNNISADAVSNGTKLIVGYLKVKKNLSPLAGMAAKPLPIAVTEKPKADPIKPPVKPDAGTEPLPPVKNPEKEKIPVVEPPKKDPPKPVPVAIKNEPVVPSEIKGTGSSFNGGYFKSNFENAGGETVKEAGAANVFKSSSGWSDGKYYCLHNNAQPGTILKITSNTTGKSIYAKVLDAVPDIKQNNGLLIRISNAAAEELAVGENKFDCTISYSK
jgi:LysM repeat protein